MTQNQNAVKNKVSQTNNRKVKNHATQLKTIFLYLQNHVATASMVTEATGVPQKCICRYKRDLEKSKLLWEIKKDVCKHTGFRAWYLSTDPGKAPKCPKQTSLFEEPESNTDA